MSIIRLNKSQLEHLFILLVFLLVSPATPAQTEYYENLQEYKLSVNTPNAYALHKAELFPVNLFNGQADISIPLYTLRDGDVEIPIILRYSTSGIKLQEEASWIGLGWSLEVGGKITQSVQGVSDNNPNSNFDYLYGSYTNRCCFTDGNNDEHCADYTFDYVTNALLDLHPSNTGPQYFTGAPLPINSSCDYLNVDFFLKAPWKFFQPDVYYYNFFGNSGKFCIRYDNDKYPGDTILIDGKENLKFIDHYLNGWQAIDPHGNTFYFELDELVMTSSGITYSDENWYLTM